MQPAYKRVLIKISGEGLMGSKPFGVDNVVVSKIAKQIKDIRNMGVDVCVVVGGGNIFRGAKEAASGMNRSIADQVGMMATVINALFLQDALQKQNVKTVVMSGLRVPQACETYIYRKAIKHLDNGKVIIFAGGTGSPYFTTDTGATLRACEMGCDAILKSTQVDGVYDSDPKQNPNAVRFDEISFEEVVQKQLKVMDLTAVTLAKENNISVVVFEQKSENSIVDAVCLQGKFTIIKNRG
ncbi:MAG: UMP kinase [Alphaproteobacteria bacterium]|nr:UMP kinase [Alphaproteobacteria bacterium]